eukprot:scaffold5822_cov46-Cyclotella_meneghiniana.AAC.6
MTRGHNCPSLPGLNDESSLSQLSKARSRSSASSTPSAQPFEATLLYHRPNVRERRTDPHIHNLKALCLGYWRLMTVWNEPSNVPVDSIQSSTHSQIFNCFSVADIKHLHIQTVVIR